ncbi:hypothetical protein SNOG_06969 [Parastagonospora nodorum SN15]|uniref:Uncharacterized protein n=1 Tax=Phaeosphaeria nodorum (strain SN15 / ATCC MYA-4574 / FGSC 10173) TaxID=321614 RepID=Q0UMP5_PHANO|nr:hypothetical protein SNOG_06969 [Parastagonospora nodorum SN15]EAT85620.1 hypothetical protein SNOG_06969 [Parastagonospora nodorum SN15]
MGDKRLQPWDMAEATFGSGQGDLRRLAAGSWIACRDRVPVMVMLLDYLGMTSSLGRLPRANCPDMPAPRKVAARSGQPSLPHWISAIKS